jgi:mevalonate kinase
VALDASAPRGADGLPLLPAEALAGRVGCVGRASGKAILVGEHFVVHGGPALAVPVSASLTVTLGADPGWSGPELAQRGIPAMLEALGLPAGEKAGIGGRVEGELPLGAGLGGSAALAAALLRALGVEEGAALARAIHRCEKVAHGRPSGLDGLTVAMERPVWLPEVEGGAVVETPGDFEHPLGRAALAELLEPIPESELPLMVAVVPREGSTRLAVAQVARFRQDHPEVFAGLFERTAVLAGEARRALSARDWPTLGRVFDQAHEPLASLGLVSARQAAVVEAARRHGALGAKLSGAGLGGAVVICHPWVLGHEAQSVLDLEAILRQAGAVQVFGRKVAGR